MASEVDICNLALGHIGNQSINSLTQALPSAIRCNQFYPIARDAVLRDHKWNFSTMTETLAEISGESIIGWEYLYAYPARCLLVHSVFDESGLNEDKPQEFKEMMTPTTLQKCIAARISPAYAEYTFQVLDTSLYDPLCVLAISYYLGSLIAKPLTGDINIGKNLMALYAEVISRAKAVNASTGYVKKNPTSSYINAR